MDLAFRDMRIRFGALLLASLLGTAGAARADDYNPDLRRIRAGLQRGAEQPALPPQRSSASDTVRTQAAPSGPRDSVWNGALIGAAIGAGGGHVWARNICGSNDSECFYIAAPVGVLSGAAIEAVIGAVADALHR